MLQVLQSAMDLLQIATGITILAYTNRYFTENSRWVPLFSATCNFQIELNATEPNPPIDRLFSLVNYFQMQLDIRMLMFGDFTIFI